MPVITLSRQYGSLGDEIAHSVAGQLRLRLVNGDIINEVAQRLGVSPDRVTGHDEREPGVVSDLVRTMRRLYPATLAPDPEDSEVDEAAYLQVIRQVIWEVVRAGDAVIMGRGAPFIVGSHPEVLHVLIIAPLNVRAERVMAAEAVDHDMAVRKIREADGQRSRYIRHFYRTNWLDVEHYDLVLNTGQFSETHACDLIRAATSVQGADR